MTLATTAPAAPTTVDVVGDLRAQNQQLAHTIRHAIPALEAARARTTGTTGGLLADVISDLRAALTENRTPA